MTTKQEWESWKFNNQHGLPNWKSNACHSCKLLFKKNRNYIKHCMNKHGGALL